MPQLSIVVPIYNKEKYLKYCIDSILNQSYKDYELILIDDGSTDGCGSICDSYSLMYDNIKVVHQHNLGVSAARNLGLSIASGKFIGFVDSDDVLHVEMYETLINNILKFDADISICGLRKIYHNKVESLYGSGSFKVYDNIASVESLLKKDFSQSVYDKLYKSEIAKSITFEGRMNEDIYYNFKAMYRSNKIIFHDVILYDYLVRDNSLSMSKFSEKYMDIIDLSARIVEFCYEYLPEVLKDAELFHFINNFSLFNILLLSENKRNSLEFTKILTNLVNLFNSMSKDIPKKYNYSFKLFSISPCMYKFLLLLYSKVVKSDLLRRI